MGGIPLILGGIHITLSVLNAHAHGERLLLHGDACLIEHGKGIAGAVTRRNDQLTGG